MDLSSCRGTWLRWNPALSTARFAEAISTSAWSFPRTGAISATNLFILEDDQGFFPSYLLAPVVRQPTLERYPAIKPILESLSAQLENESMAALNAAVDLEGRKIDDVARTFLRSRRLLGQR